MSTQAIEFAPLSGPNRAADIAGQLRRMLGRGQLQGGDRLPSTRDLARDLGVARGTVVSALDTLIAEGLLEARRGSGTFVTAGCKLVSRATHGPREAPPRPNAVRPDTDPHLPGVLEFRVCRPSVDDFPQNAWRRAVADAAGRRPAPDYGDAQGEPELRVAIASYLCRARGLDVSADEVIVTNGAVHAMQILAGLYLDASTTVAFEDPGYPLARQIFARPGARVIPIPVDCGGLCVEKLDATGAKLVYVTPSHQFPTGERLSLPRRQQLIDWAAANDALILEDDYDGEFRYDVTPLPPMAAMNAGGSVVYFGTFSKTLFPSLRIGFAVGPRSLIRDMARYRTITDYQTNSITQLGLANFIENGQFEKHVQRMRRRYARKRAALRDAIERTGLPATIRGTDSGLNAMIQLDSALTATVIADRARLKGVGVTPIARYTVSGDVRDNALVLGYAALSEGQIAEGVDILAREVARCDAQA
ncbi:MAG: PLP-dependent aminotransferase family protein [Pseudomonadota bacterium]